MPALQRILPSANRLMVLCLQYVLACSPGLCEGDDAQSPQGKTAESEAAWHEQQLMNHGLALDTASLVEYLQKQQRPPQTGELILQLGSRSFTDRQQATRQLMQIDVAAREDLLLATGSDDPEIAARATRLLRRVQRSGKARDAVLFSLLEVLKIRKPPEAVVPLVHLLPVCQDYLSEMANEVIWNSVNDSHKEFIREQIQSPDLLIRATAIVAHERIGSAKSADLLRPFLKAESSRIRLAASRALMNHTPKDVLPVLIDLLSSEERSLRLQAAWLLQLLSGKSFGLGDSENDADAVRQWAAWMQQSSTAQLQLPVDLRRLSSGQFRTTFFESFSTSAESVRNGYGRFEYEATLDVGGRVGGSRLRLDGDHDECDQRLFLTAPRMLGRPRFPDNLRIVTTLGGSGKGSGAWHVGVSIGNVRILFHPGYTGGGFRIEQVSDHKYITNNASMGFTPVMNQLYEMVITTAPGRRNLIEIHVEVSNPDRPSERFSQTFSLPRSVTGEFTRIGLERSGRTGGPAIFESILIRANGS